MHNFDFAKPSTIADAAKALADKYCGSDGGEPDLGTVAKLSPKDYGVVRAPLADALGIPVKFLDDELKARRHRGDLQGSLAPGRHPFFQSGGDDAAGRGGGR